MRLAISIGLLALLSINCVYAEPPAPQESEEILLLPPKAYQNPLELKWDQVHEALRRNDLTGANTRLEELNQLRRQSGFAAMDEYSYFLIAQGFDKLRAKDLDSAAFFARKALQLSPNSPAVLIQSLRLVDATGTARVSDQLAAALKNLPGHYDLVLRSLNVVSYGFMFALTLALYLVLALLFANNGAVILRRSVKFFPVPLRGLGAPLCALLLLFPPLYFGLFWSIVGWSVALLIWLPERRWIVFCAGAVFALWGSLVPIKENVALWLEDQGVQSMLRVASGSYAHWDTAVLKELTQKRPDDALASYTYAQLLRREGQLEEAEQAFEHTELLLGNQPYTKAQRGMISFLKGESQTSDRHYKQALELGADSPEFYYNYSKVRFELHDTAQGREYFERALKQNPGLIQALSKQEELLGIRSPYSFAEVSLPMQFVLKSALVPNIAASIRSDQIISSLMRGMTAPWLLLAGGLLILLFFLRNKSGRRISRAQGYYSSYRTPESVKLLTKLVPGGAWILNGKVGWSFLILASFLFLAAPIVGWPREIQNLNESVPDFGAYYLVFFSIISVLSVYVGFYLDEERLES